VSGTYYGKGDKDTIMSTIATAIQNITTIDLGSRTDVYTDYQRAYDAASSPDKFPGAFVNDVTEDKHQLLSDICKNTFTVGIVGWVRAGVLVGTTTPENLWTKMNDFVQAIKDVVQADPSLGQQAYKTVCTRVRTDAGSRWPVGVFAMVFTVIYFSDY